MCSGDLLLPDSSLASPECASRVVDIGETSKSSAPDPTGLSSVEGKGLYRGKIGEGGSDIGVSNDEALALPVESDGDVNGEDIGVRKSWKGLGAWR